MLPGASHINLTLYDALGRKILDIVDAEYAAGAHSVFMNTSALPPGVYFYRFTAGERVVQRKMVVVR